MNEKFDKEKYDEIHEIVTEILEAIRERKEISSCKKLLDFMQENNSAVREFQDRITSNELYLRYSTARMERDKEKDVWRLLESLTSEKKKRAKRKALYIKVMSAAASLILLVVTWQLMIYSEKEIPQIDYSKNVEQIEKPTLFLDNGSKLELQNLKGKLLNEKYGVREIASNRMVCQQPPIVGEKVEYNTLIVPAGYNYSVELVDGSEVKLNAGSRLKYAISGESSVREVELDGEAYFRVAKSTDPFLVKMNDGTYVKVYGTEFNACRDQDGNVEVVLVNGKVSFNTIEGKEIMLHPNQKCDYSAKNGEANIVDVNVASYVSWTHDEFNYDQVTLDYFLKKVAAWYGVQFKYEKDKIENIKFYISVKRAVTLSDLLLLIEKSTDLSFVKESDKVFVIK